MLKREIKMSIGVVKLLNGAHGVLNKATHQMSGGNVGNVGNSRGGQVASTAGASTAGAGAS